MQKHALERDDTSIITFDDPVPPELTDQEEKSESLFEQLRSDPNSYINVMRQPLGGRNTMEFVARYEADQFDYGGMMAHIQKVYGGGDYRIMAYFQGRLKGNKLVTIAHPIKIDSPVQDTALNTVLTQMEKMHQAMASLYQEKQTGGNSRKEMLEEMMMFKTLFDTGAKQSNGIKDAIDMIGSLKDLGIDIGIGGEKESGWGDLAEKFLPLATMALTPQPALAPRMMRANPQARPVQRPQPQPHTHQQEKNPMNLMVKMGVAQLVNAASKNSDPANYAGMIVDNVTEDVLKQFFAQPNLDVLKSVNPNVGKFEPWFLELGEHVKAIIGLPSTVSDLYDVDEVDTLDDNDEIETDDNADVSITHHSERNSGDTPNP